MTQHEPSTGGLLKRACLATLLFVITSLSYKSLFLARGGPLGALFATSERPHSLHELIPFLLPWGRGAFHWPALATAALMVLWSTLVSTPRFPSLPFFSRHLLFLYPALILHLAINCVFIIPHQVDFLFQFRMPFMFLDFVGAYLTSLIATVGTFHGPAAPNIRLNLSVRSVTRLAAAAPPTVPSNGGGQGARPSRPAG